MIEKLVAEISYPILNCLWKRLQNQRLCCAVSLCLLVMFVWADKYKCPNAFFLLLLTCIYLPLFPSVLMDLKQKRNSHHGGSNDNVEISVDSATKQGGMELGPRTCSTSAIHLHTSTPISRLQSRPKGVRCCCDTPAASKSQAISYFLLR